MKGTIRKLVVGLFALAVLWGVYWFYLQVNRTPPMPTEVAESLPALPARTAGGSPNEVGTILNVGIDRVEQTRLVHRNDKNEVDRIFGFERLVHRRGSQWETTNPYLQMFLPTFRCTVTANRGRVQVDTAFSRVVAGDATFTGNVVIHIVPMEPNEALEGFIHLDEVDFIASRSLFTSAGSVRFLSRRAQLTGKGMDLLYDEGRNRLELFRIFELESLRTRFEELGSLADLTPQRRSPEAAPSASPPVAARKPPVSPGSGMAAPRPAAAPQSSVVPTRAAGPAPAQTPMNAAGGPRPPDRYQCVFRKNVVIQTPNDLITAQERLTIAHLVWLDSRQAETPVPAAPHAGPAASEKTPAAPAPEPVAPTAAKAADGAKSPAQGAPKPAVSKKPEEASSAPYPGPPALDTSASSHLVISSIPAEFFDTVITCDGGLMITPEGKKVPPPEPRTDDREPKGPEMGQVTREGPLPDVARPAAPEPLSRQRTTAAEILFDALSTDTTLAGPVQMVIPLDPNGAPARKPMAGTVPMTVTARDRVRFVAAVDEVLFEGDCKVVMSKPEPNALQEYTLTAPQMVMYLMSDANRPKETAVSARKLVTRGGPAALRILRRSPDRLLGGTQLDAARLEYELDPRGPVVGTAGPMQGAQFTAVGPGELWIRNEENLEPQADPNRFSLRQPCVARLTSFDKLIYFSATNHVIAEDDARQLVLDYFTLADGKYDRHTRTVAGHVEALLQEAAQGSLELVSLAASDGIEYEDEARQLSFSGASLWYDHAQSQVLVRGDDEQRCYFNGTQVPYVELNLKTGQVKTEFPTPSTLPAPPRSAQ
ncbi:MAG: hypothetical protein MUC88_02245 [Planctomycetes bacterium]|jgi:hypothetical protein|nr:hypothetical protein [Planctomycetota bacterium]